MTTPRFGRVLTAMVTPFRADGAIDFDVAIELATYLVAEGCDGLVVAGSTGEGSSLSDKEKLELFACVAGAVEVPVLAGSTSADTAQSVGLTRQGLETGVTGAGGTKALGDGRGQNAKQSSARHSIWSDRTLHSLPSLRAGNKRGACRHLTADVNFFTVIVR